MSEHDLKIETTKIKGIKNRSAIAIERYLELLQESLVTRSLLETVSTHIRLSAPDNYKQVSLDNPVKAFLQKAGYIEPGFVSLQVCYPLEVSEPTNIQNFNAGRYSSTVIELKTDLNISGSVAAKGDLLKVLRVEKQASQIQFVSLKSNHKFVFDLTSPTFQKAVIKAVFYYEAILHLSVGDIVFQTQSPHSLKQVASISDDEIRFVDKEGHATTLKPKTAEARMLSLGYAASGEAALCYQSKSTIVIIDGDEKSDQVKSFIKQMKKNTSRRLYVYGVEKTLRKSVQVVCPTDMIKCIKTAIEDSKKSHQGYVEALIDELLRNDDAAQDEDTGYMSLYSSPPSSKAHAFWISDGHYERLKSFCDKSGLMMNRLAHHLVFRDLLRRDLIKLNDLLM